MPSSGWVVAGFRKQLGAGARGMQCHDYGQQPFGSTPPPDDSSVQLHALCLPSQSSFPHASGFLLAYAPGLCCPNMTLCQCIHLALLTRWTSMLLPDWLHAATCPCLCVLPGDAELWPRSHTELCDCTETLLGGSMELGGCYQYSYQLGPRLPESCSTALLVAHP